MDAPIIRRALYRGLQISILPYLFFNMAICDTGYRCESKRASD